jgi:hypothetical protein
MEMSCLNITPSYACARQSPCLTPSTSTFRFKATLKPSRAKIPSLSFRIASHRISPLINRTPPFSCRYLHSSVPTIGFNKRAFLRSLAKHHYRYTVSTIFLSLFCDLSALKNWAARGLGGIRLLRFWERILPTASPTSRTVCCCACTFLCLI